MKSTDLSKQQAQKMHSALAPTLGYLSRLVLRLEAKTFPADDRMYVAALKAQAAMGELVMTLHYLTCSGVSVPGTPSYNVAPTQAVAVVRPAADHREAVLMRWGLIPSWAKDMKARSEPGPGRLT